MAQGLGFGVSSWLGELGHATGPDGAAGSIMINAPQDDRDLLFLQAESVFQKIQDDLKAAKMQFVR